MKSQSLSSLVETFTIDLKGKAKNGDFDLS
jgi:hypothetical protein